MDKAGLNAFTQIIRTGQLMLELDPKTTALVLIDLQKGILGRELAPYSAQQILKSARELTERFRSAGAPVILVNVTFAKDFADALKQPVDQPMLKPTDGYPENFSELADNLARPGDVFITKHQWGAFYGTELDLQLRRRGIQSIVLGGVATNMGVESTARQAWEHGYAVIFAEESTSALSDELHHFAFAHIFPKIGRVATNEQLTFTLL